MKIRYSTNWMGPVSLRWYEERGLLEDDGVTPTIRYSAGRIDIRDDTKEGYDGWNEYSVAPMHGEDWNAFSDWLNTVETDDLWKYEHLIEQFEKYYGKQIRWAKNISELNDEN
ncbi:MAG: hypothetical protein ACO3MB_09120 [Saprospiraceae bacterium]